MKTWRALLVAVLVLQVGQAAAVDLYALQSVDPSTPTIIGPFTLYRINTDSLGSPYSIGIIHSGANYYQDLAALVRVTPDTLYTVDRATNMLLTISTADASVLQEVELDTNVPVAPRGFDISPIDGQLYGVFSGPRLFTIDPSTGATSLVSNITGTSNLEAIAFAPDGTLYAAGNGQVYTLDTATAVATVLGVTALDIDALTFAPDGFLYGADSYFGIVDADLIRIDPSTGAFDVANLGSTGVYGFNGIAAGRVIQISIDIKPGDGPNSVNPRSSGVIPVAVLSTAEFDATTVDFYTVQFGPGQAQPAHSQPHIEDVDGDGLMDLVLHFRTEDTGIQCGETEATLTGDTWDGAGVQGTDSISTVGCNNGSNQPAKVKVK
jgi:hypothetical protein